MRSTPKIVFHFKSTAPFSFCESGLEIWWRFPWPQYKLRSSMFQTVLRGALVLHECVHVTDIGVGYISTMLSLSALFLRWCSQVRDFGLQHLCGMRNLQVLSLAGCPLLTSSGLSSLIQLRHLQELELTNCPGASRELFEYLREHLPRCLVIE
uniref:ATP synthase subunit s, mitochondrial n=1 Tax=Timema douglasi TaxID=61478 RepID=A0A7R8ZA46_TIMDO|nr:unnamed protein product [Timema douglasi]